MTINSTTSGLLDAYSLPSAICNKHGQRLESSRSFDNLWPLAENASLKAMLLQQDRWESDWRMVLRNRTIELIETRLCEPLNKYMLRSSRIGQLSNDPLFLIELHPRKEFTGGFAKLANYHMQSQRHKQHSHLMNLKMLKAVEESQTDPLTGLANRRSFDERMKDVWHSAIKDRRPIVLFSADIDHFKAINDQLGHSRGDEVLIQIAHSLDKVLSRDNDVVARVGGEEFSMVLPDTQPDGGRSMARSAVAAIAKLNIPHPKSTASNCVTISLGCSSLQPKPSDSIDTLIKAADRALYYSKQHGRNCASYMDLNDQSLTLINN